MSTEAVQSLLPAHTTEIICYQNYHWIQVLPEWLWLQAQSAISIHVVGSILVYRKLLVYEQSVYEFLLHFWHYFSQCLFWPDVFPRIFSNAQNTKHPIAVCAVAAASHCSHFSQCFVVKFCVNHFQCLHLKKLIFVCYILWGFDLNCVNFPHSFNTLLFVHRLMTKDFTGIQWLTVTVVCCMKWILYLWGDIPDCWNCLTL